LTWGAGHGFGLAASNQSFSREDSSGTSILESIPEQACGPSGGKPLSHPNPRKTLALICLLSLVDGMDIQLLPASFKALEVDLGLRPTNLALLAVCQGYAMCISGPFWASLADHGCSRKWLLVLGCAAWGFLTFLLAIVDSFQAMVILRTLNGCALGLLQPVIQSFLADLCQKSDLGLSFGLVDFCHTALGQTAALVSISFVADLEICGMAGWRFAFISVAFFSIGMAVPLALCIEEQSREWRPDGVGLLGEFRKFFQYMQNPSFLVLLSQGIFGTIPSSALAFTPMYFQYMGIGSMSGLLTSFKIVGSGIGSICGGYLGDRMCEWSPGHGRIFIAQSSVLFSIPAALSIFLFVPQQPELWPLYAGLLFSLGLLHWCSAGCNRPILMELVPPDSIASVVAWMNCIEHLSGFIFGPVGVAMLSELLFDYRPTQKSTQPMTAWEREVNTSALGSSLAICTTLPWTLCFILYGMLHVTYRPIADDDHIVQNGCTDSDSGDDAFLLRNQPTASGQAYRRRVDSRQATPHASPPAMHPSSSLPSFLIAKNDDDDT